MSSKRFGEGTRQSLQNLLNTLRRERDELSVQINLGKMELRDEWEDVESKWHTFERKVEHKVEEVNDDAKESLQEIGQEIAETYKMLRGKLD